MANLIMPPAIPTLTVGGQVFTDLKNLKVLVGGFAGAANGNCTFRLPSGNSGYTPSGSNKFRFLAIQIVAISVAPGSFAQICYSDNDVGFVTNTAFTNQINPGADVRGGFFCSSSSVSTSTFSYEIAVNFLVPNGKYPGISNNASAFNCAIRAFGYEEA